MNEETYLSKAKYWDNSIIGVFIGITSSVAINLLTSELNSWFLIGAIACNVVSISVLVRLIVNRRDIDKAMSDRDDLLGNPDLKWQHAANYSGRGKVFIRCYRLFRAFFLVGLLLIVTNSLIKNFSNNGHVESDITTAKINSLNGKLDSVIHILSEQKK